MEITPPRLEPSFTRTAQEPAVPVDVTASPTNIAAPLEADPAPDGDGSDSQIESGFSGASPASTRWRQPAATPAIVDTQPRNPSLPTFVGLIMLILTFFIVLTSMSINDRKKSDAALVSLQDAFAGDALPGPAEEPDAETVSRDFIAGLTGRIQSLVPLMGGQKTTPAEDQVLWLPLSLAFNGAGTEVVPAFTPVLRELLVASEKIPDRFDYKVELRLCAETANEQLRLRATALARALIALQAPLSNFVVGTEGCQPDRMAFAVALAPQVAEASP